MQRRETVISRADGALARYEEKGYFQPFTNRAASGRTGHGGTLTGAYLGRRSDWFVEESLQFAVVLPSIKNENHGPYRGGLADVLEGAGLQPEAP